MRVSTLLTFFVYFWLLLPWADWAFCPHVCHDLFYVLVVGLQTSKKKDVGMVCLQDVVLNVCKGTSTDGCDGVH